MKYLFSILLLALSIASVNVQSKAVANNIGKIKQLSFYEGHAGILLIHDNMIDPSGCGRNDYYIVSDEKPYFKEIYSLLLSTSISKSNVQFHIDGCYQGMPKITNIHFVP